MGKRKRATSGPVEQSGFGDHLDLRSRIWGQHYTPQDVFEKFIWPEIRDILWDYLWTDLFAGTGNLILPILQRIPEESREDFFREHIYLQEVDPQVFGELRRILIDDFHIRSSLVNERLVLADSFRKYPPKQLLGSHYPIFHITNPPYLYLGYIRKKKEFSIHLDLFEKEREGLQDLYQVALWNDVVQGLVSRSIYILPTNFLFGDSASRKIRRLVLQKWNMEKVIILEKGIFEKTGTHVGIFFFKKKQLSLHEEQTFPLLMLNSSGSAYSRTYTLSPRNSYRAGSTFWDFVEKYRFPKPLSFKFHLSIEEVIANEGSYEITLLDANNYEGNGKGYRKFKARVNACLLNKLRSNPVYIKTLDTGRENGRAGLYFVSDLGVDGIVVTKAPYRTHPIQIFFDESLDAEGLRLVVKYFNGILNYFRQAGDGEFLTTYKYSKSAKYTRKYLSLKVASAILETFPISILGNERKRKSFAEALDGDNMEAVLELLEQEKYKTSSNPSMPSLLELVNKSEKVE